MKARCGSHALRVRAIDAPATAARSVATSTSLAGFDAPAAADTAGGSDRDRAGTSPASRP
jgi:hypothetical protein